MSVIFPAYVDDIFFTIFVVQQPVSHREEENTVEKKEGMS